MLDTSRSNRCVTGGPYRAENEPQRRRSELAGSDEQEVREASPTRLSWILPNCLDRLARFADPFDHEPGLFERFRVHLKRERPPRNRIRRPARSNDSSKTWGSR